MPTGVRLGQLDGLQSGRGPLLAANRSTREQMRSEAAWWRTCHASGRRRRYRSAGSRVRCL